ncbi:MAG TPA: hypothetical protein VI110_00280, partial [Lapillicoccus sp.]
GTVVGETVGYALTAALIAAGTVESLGVPMAGLLNFVGYVVWSAWLVAFAVRVLLVARRTRTLPVG